jgi:hypothetical protein
VFDPINIDPFQSIVDPIKNAIISDPDAIPVVAGQLEGTGRTRVSGESSDLPYDPLEGRSFKLIEVLLCRGEDEEVIHGAS